MEYTNLLSSNSDKSVAIALPDKCWKIFRDALPGLQIKYFLGCDILFET